MLKHLPNALTISRAVSSLIIPWLLLDGGDVSRIVAFVIYGVACCADGADGMLARKLNATSHFGRMLDPIADKMLIIACLFTVVTVDGWFLLFDGWLVFVPALLIILREVFISGLREFTAAQNITIAVSWLGKIKTNAQILAIGAMMIVPVTPVSWQMGTVAVVLLWMAMILTLVSGWQYLMGALRHGFDS